MYYAQCNNFYLTKSMNKYNIHLTIGIEGYFHKNSRFYSKIGVDSRSMQSR